MKERVTINAVEHEDGGLERAEANLMDGNDVVLENFYYERDSQKTEALVLRFKARVAFNSDCKVCHISLT